jgi:hypothetical protein
MMARQRVVYTYGSRVPVYVMRLTPGCTIFVTCITRQRSGTKLLATLIYMASVVLGAKVNCQPNYNSQNFPLLIVDLLY